MAGSNYQIGDRVWFEDQGIVHGTVISRDEKGNLEIEHPQSRNVFLYPEHLCNAVQPEHEAEWFGNMDYEPQMDGPRPPSKETRIRQRLDLYGEGR